MALTEKQTHEASPTHPSQLAKRHNLSWVLTAIGVIGAALLALELVRFLDSALNNATVFVGSPADGTFQLYNPLRRLDAGQIPGHDFQFFHGLGTLLLHYPLFELLGRNLFAVELGRWTLSPFLFVGSAALAFWAITKRWQITAAATAVLVVVGHFWFRLLVDSFTSYMGVRSFLPVVILAILLLWPPPEPATRRALVRSVALGVFLALSFFISTEQGIAMMGAYLVASLLLGPERSLGARARHTGIVAASSLAGTILLFFATSGTHFMEPIRYALADIPADQFWYFGAPPAPILSSVAMFFSDRLVVIAYAVALGLFIICGLMYRRTRGYPLFVGMLALIYGIGSSVGLLSAYGSNYVQMLLRIDLLVAFGLAFHGLPYLAIDWRDMRWRLLAVTGTVVTVAFLGVGIFRYSRIILLTAPTVIAQYHSRHGVLGTQLGGFWAQSNATTMNVLRSDPGTVWSLYAGLPEAQLGQLQSSGYDYIIHALGPERRPQYLARFDQTRPKYVITFSPAFFIPWEPWIENEQWGFFERLTSNYTLVSETFYSQIWKRTAQPWTVGPRGGWQSVKLSPRQQAIDLGAFPKGTTMEVKLKYTVTNSGGTLPFIGKLPRYLVTPSINGQAGLAISLPPYMREFTFPVFVQQDGQVTLSSQVTPDLFNAHLNIEGIQVRTLEGAAVQSLQASQFETPR